MPISRPVGTTSPYSTARAASSVRSRSARWTTLSSRVTSTSPNTLMRIRPLPAYAWTCHINKGSCPLRPAGTTVRVFLSRASRPMLILLARLRRPANLTSCSRIRRVNGAPWPLRGGRAVGTTVTFAALTPGYRSFGQAIHEWHHLQPRGISAGAIVFRKSVAPHSCWSQGDANHEQQDKGRGHERAARPAASQGSVLDGG